MARQGARADRGAGDRGADGKAPPRQRAAYDPQQRGLAAEQMGAAGDVEEQPMRRIERHQRREAVAPVGDVVQRLGDRRPRRRRTPSIPDRSRGHWRAAGRSKGRSARRHRRARRSAARCFAWRRRRWGISVSIFPPPLAGEALAERGWRQRQCARGLPLSPGPPPQGGRERTVRVVRTCLTPLRLKS